MTEQLCRTCRFWERIGGGDVGECRIHPPRPAFLADAARNEFRAVWPETAEDEWCGSHQPEAPE